MHTHTHMLTAGHHTRTRSRAAFVWQPAIPHGWLAHVLGNHPPARPGAVDRHRRCPTHGAVWAHGRRPPPTTVAPPWQSTAPSPEQSTACATHLCIVASRRWRRTRCFRRCLPPEHREECVASTASSIMSLIAASSDASATSCAATSAAACRTDIASSSAAALSRWAIRTRKHPRQTDCNRVTATSRCSSRAAWYRSSVSRSAPFHHARSSSCSAHG
jgi:hypothetical protein